MKKQTPPPRFAPLVPLALLFACQITAPAAPVEMTGAGSHSEDFDTLPNATPNPNWVNDSTLPGWYAAYESPADPFIIRVDDGNLSSGGIYSYGADASSERALGSLGSGGPDDMAYGVLFQNTSAVPLTINSITYSGEQWRNGSGTTVNDLTLSYMTSSSPITGADLSPADVTPPGWITVVDGKFSSVVNTDSAGPLDGSNPANQDSINSTPSITVSPGDYVFLRWHDIDNAGSDRGLAIDNLAVNWVVESSPFLALGALPDTFAENAGAAASTGTVTIPASLGANLTVNLSSSDTSSATVPASVEIIAGNTSQTFPIDAVDDFLADPDAPVTITASAAGYVDGQVGVTVEADADAPIGVLVSPDTFAENAGAAAATGFVQIAEPAVGDLVVTLTSFDTSEVAVPESVTILNGEDTATFDVDAVDDSDPDGTRTVTIRAEAPGYTLGTTTVMVTDDGDTAPAPTLSPGAVAFVGFNADADDNLAFVALTAIAETDKIIFTDAPWNGLTVGVDGEFAPTEGIITWTAPAGGVAAGTVVTLDDLDGSGRSASVGTLSSIGSFNMSGGGDTVFAYQGAAGVATGFLAGVSNNSEGFAGTGLGAEHMVIFATAIDVGAYTGGRNTQATFAGYLTPIGNTAANWTTDDGSGDQSGTFIPFDTTAFTLFVGGSDYDTWALDTGATGGPTGDGDKDGRSNDFERAFGLIPTSGSSLDPFVSPLDRATGKFTFTRRTQSLTGLTYKVFTSTTLNALEWTEDTGATVQVSGPVDDIETVEVTLSAAKPLTAPRLFIQVVAE